MAAEVIEIDGSTQFNEKVACNVSFFREEHGLSQEALALKSGLTKMQVSRIESQKFKKRVDESYIENIAKAFGVEPDAITESNSEVAGLIAYLDTSAFQLPQIDKALDASERLIDLSRKQGPLVRAFALMYRGLLHYYRSEYGTATEFYERAMIYAKQSADADLLQRVRRNLASGFMMVGMYQSAEEMIRSTLKATKDETKKGKDLFKLASLFYNQNKFEDAEVIFLDALKTFEQHDSAHETKGKCLQGLGTTYRYLKNPQKAIAFSFEAAEFAERTGDSVTAIYSYRTLGEIHRDLDLPGDAQMFFQKAADTAEKFNRQYDLLVMMFDLFSLNSDFENMKNIALSLQNFDGSSFQKARIFEVVAEAATDISEAKYFYRKANEELRKK